MAKKKLSVPRELTEVQTEYQRLCANAGQLQYQLRVYERELERINNQLEGVNREAAARVELDNQKKAETTTEASAT